MIRVYLDWNVFSRLEHNDEAYKRLTEILSDESKYILPYSPAHLKDLYRSYKKVGMEGIEGHLEKIQKYSKSLFIVYTIKHVLEFQFLDSKESMKQHAEAYDEHEDFDFNVDKMMEALEPFSSMLDSLFKIQLPNFTAKQTDDEKVNKEIANTRSSELVKRLMGTEETISMKDMMQNLMTMSSTLYEDDSYSEWREGFQQDIKVSGRIKDKRFNPMETLDENAQKLQKKDFMELFESMLIGEDKKSFFNKIIALVRQLDFHGFYPDKIEKGHHLDNVETDYEHIAYATSCDIFIVNDNKTKAKAALAYELLKLNVRVVTPKEYVEFIEKNSAEIENGQHLVDYLFWIPTTEPTLEINGRNAHYIPSFVLNYFNMASYPIDNPKSIILQKMDTPNRVGIFVKEIEAIKEKLISFYGTQLKEFGNVGEDTYLIAWLTDELVLIKLQLSEGNFTLEVSQCKKMTRYEKFIASGKSIIGKVSQIMRFR
ncbi:hypothetical protein FCR2A7T_20110 [Flavobacterium cauense R2A-7]|uniref:Uncharacterized protein n=1 Tax=Flavobacterium cauense R2A-7 TaxID=1341154 RepID=V6RZE7_9FLAO|nr:hypothetical protein [Flavobacterium cauense]ESU19397.1 hypothetical protein FCR2A7T_20110 [Flavobacterium cauense R2A-7]KGO80361.1 hypothetical protein Q762_12050 [Flavobacterium cauense R2A-7]TWI09366.1 hypothetical protein IP98_02528 [Flavobacterium cauense R2A-7]